MKNTSKNLKIGQKVWYIEPNELSRKRDIPDEKLLHETEIEKIGRKYFYVKGSRNGIDLKTMYDTVSYGFGYTMKVFLNKEEFIKNRETARKREKILKFFGENINLKYFNEEEITTLLNLIDKAEERKAQK